VAAVYTALPMAYFDWHEEPGYFRDVTRHFDSGADVLDVGCGTGWISRHLPRYTGVDGSPDAVQQAQALGRNVLLADVDSPLPFPDCSFDGVILKDLLEHVTNPVAVVTESLRVLRPGGIVFASSPDAQRWVWNDYTHRRPFTRRAFQMLFRDQGFENVRASYESVMPGTSIISKRTADHRRPAPLRAAAWLPMVRRNVTVVAHRAK
jgi:SAM-dependent methyltransferase